MKDSSSGHALYITKANVTPDEHWMNKMDFNIYGDPSVSLLRLYGGVALLFDTSGSMSWRHDGTWPVPPQQQRITFAKEAAYPFLEMLNDFANKRINFGIATFPPHPWNSSVGCSGQVVTPMTLVTDTSKNTAVTTTIPGLVAEANTPLLAGMSKAVGMFGSEANRAIVLLSDGYHNCPGLVKVGDPQVTALISQLNVESVRVFTIGFGRPTDIDHPLLEAFAAGTGGKFYDVTTPAFNPATWDPATALQSTYKAILVDTLGLETAADPMGVIRAKEKVTYEVGINEHDRRVSFFLSWVTPQRNRLGLSVKSSDGQKISTTTTPGVELHEGKTYKIITVDESFLHRSGRIGPTPWEIEIDADQLDNGEREKYQYSVVLDSGLKMKAAFDRDSYGTGDTITITAEITEAGQPMTGLKDVYVDVTRPAEGFGNWFAANKVSGEQLMQIPEKRGDENLSLLQRKAVFLSDVRKIALPGVMGSVTLRLYDDGTHGDARPSDGIYTNQYTDTAKEGTYSFYFRSTGPTSGGNTFTRDAVIQKHVAVNVVPEYVLVDVSRLPSVEERLKQFKITITPRDPLGNHLGPRYSGLINLSASRGEFIDQVQDNLDGTYSQVLQLPQDVDIGDVDITVDVEGAELAFNLAKKLEKPYGVSLHVGGAIPTGSFGEDYGPGYSIGLDFDYHFTSQLSAFALLGYNHFSSESSSIGSIYWWNISANLRHELTIDPFRPYLNAGLGIYIPESGSTRPGFNAGVGLGYPLTPAWVMELGTYYHHVFTSDDDTQFLVPHFALIYRF